jgi:hypothetical protein
VRAITTAMTKKTYILIKPFVTSEEDIHLKTHVTYYKIQACNITELMPEVKNVGTDKATVSSLHM